MFIAALFTAAWTWEEPTCSSTDEQAKKLWYIYTIKRNKCESAEMKPMNLEPVTQNEVSQRKNKYMH